MGGRQVWLLFSHSGCAGKEGFYGGSAEIEILVRRLSANAPQRWNGTGKEPEDREAGSRADRTHELRVWEQEASSREMASSPFLPVMEKSGEEDRGWCFLVDPQTSSQDLGTAGRDTVHSSGAALTSRLCCEN